MNLAVVWKMLAVGTWSAVLILLMPAAAPAQGTPGANAPATAVLHATVTITGGLSFTGSFDARQTAATCADLAKNGTGTPGVSEVLTFYVPVPPLNPDGSPGPVGGGHNFATDAAAWPYNGPGTYTGPALNATQMSVDTLPGDQETHFFAFPTGVGTLVVKPDASGSFQFQGLQDPGSVTISGQVTWTCS